MKSTLFIASEVRSGSTYIAEAIAYHFQKVYGHSLFDLTKEHFVNLKDQSTSAEILGIYDSLYRDERGWAACKIMCPSLSIISRESRKSEKVDQAFFGAESHWIIVRRRSKIEQAASLAFAKRTGDWHSYEACDSPSESLKVGPKDVEDALRAILLSDTYLEAFASFIPDNRKSVLFYEDFVSNPVSLIGRLHGVLGLPNVNDPVTYVDETKIRRNAISLKRRTVAEFSSWIVENYHAVDNGMEKAQADAAQPVIDEQLLFYEKEVSALQREIALLTRRLGGKLADRGRSKVASGLQSERAKKKIKE